MRSRDEGIIPVAAGGFTPRRPPPACPLKNDEGEILVSLARGDCFLLFQPPHPVGGAAAAGIYKAKVLSVAAPAPLPSPSPRLLALIIGNSAGFGGPRREAPGSPENTAAARIRGEVMET